MTQIMRSLALGNHETRVLFSVVGISGSYPPSQLTFELGPFRMGGLRDTTALLVKIKSTNNTPHSAKVTVTYL